MEVFGRKMLILIGIASATIVTAILVYQQVSKLPYALEVDATKDTTDISGTMYRVRVTNVGTHELTGLTVELGPGDTQTKASLAPGETYFFYPGEFTQVSKVRILTNEGIDVSEDYRSPVKTLGLPGTGR